MRLPVWDRPEQSSRGVTQPSEKIAKTFPLKVLILPTLAAAVLMLLGAIWAGWIRIGWNWPVLQPQLAGAHGPLMISGFLGALISLERAVALRRLWSFAAPLLSGLGGALLLAGVNGPLPAALLLAGSVALVGVFAWIVRAQPALYTRVMTGGAAAWAAGNFLWLIGWPVYRLVVWWAAFLILTIAGERLELGRLARHTARIERLFLLSAGIFTAGLAASLFWPDPGTRLTSLGMLALAAWLLRYDIARFTIRKAGLPRFAATSLLAGYGWLAAAGLLGLRYGAVPAGFHYDAFLHAVFLGFVFSMIFAHAPIIFPAILGTPIAFTTWFYLPLAGLHLSLALRVAGDLLLLPGPRAWGGLLNGLAILLFMGTAASAVLRGRAAGKAAAPKAERTAGRIERLLERALFPAALAMFIWAGLTGALMRWWMWQGFPAGVDFINVRHAHSHLMYFSWVTPALLALMAARLPALTGRRAPPALPFAAGAALILGLASYPLFFRWGYTSAAIGAAHLPLAVIFSSLNILAWYVFASGFYRAASGAPYSRPLKLWRWALTFLLAASAGAWGRAVLVALEVNDPFWTGAAVHLFLDLFSSGWAVLAVLGLAYASNPRLAESHSDWEDPLLLLGLPLTFLLGLPVKTAPPDLRTLAGLGGLLAAAGLWLHARRLWATAPAWRSALAYLALSAGMLAAVSLQPLALWGEAAGLRILYLHVLLLGSITLGLLAAWAQHAAWQIAWLRRMAAGVTALLLSLLPLTGLWPAQVSGDWRLAVAFVFSLGPPLMAAAWLLAAFSRKNPGADI